MKLYKVIEAAQVLNPEVCFARFFSDGSGSFRTRGGAFARVCGVTDDGSWNNIEEFHKVANEIVSMANRKIMKELVTL